MIKMGMKRGQFYLLAAIVLIAVIIGFAAVSNYTKSRSDVKVYDLGEQLGFEGGNVLEFGILEPGENDIMLDFATDFASYAGENQIIFIYGNSEEIHVVTYEQAILGDISVEGTSVQITDPTAVDKSITPPPGSTRIEVEVNEIMYTFDLKPGENFYYVISQELEGERFVATG